MAIKRVVIVQCRLSSTRLPEKALYDLGGSPVLSWVLRSMRKVEADRYYVATDRDSYDAIFPICRQEGFECFPGPLDDVLERFCLLIKKLNADTIIRATADNPFLFYEAAEKSADDFDSWRGTNKECDYLTWTGLPHGSGVEIFDGNALLRAAELTDDAYDKEHVGPALYNHKDNFRCTFSEAPLRFRAPELRTTIDTCQDYVRAMCIVNYRNEKQNQDEKSKQKKSLVSEPYTTEEILDACNSNQVKSPLVLMPSVKVGCGTGHLVRCIKIAKETFSFLYIPKKALSIFDEEIQSDSNEYLKQTSTLIDEAIKDGLNPNQIISELPDESFRPIFACDMMEIPRDMAFDLSNRGTLIAIDDGANNDDLDDYILDIIPSIREREILNQKNINFIDFPKNERKLPQMKIPEEVNSILIAFGGEDPAGFTEQVLKKCRDIFPNVKITLVTKKEIQTTEKETRFDSIPNLKEELYKYDLLFTHYGLTALEAVAAGAGVILLPTTPLHKHLAEKYGFANTTIDNFTKANINVLFASRKIYPEAILRQIENAIAEVYAYENSDDEQTLPSFMKYIAKSQKYPCPVCRTIKNDVIVSRNKLRTYRRCETCGIVYISWSGENEQKYDKEYFFESYKNQYGKTYQEDFDSIKKSCEKRVSVMNQVFRLYAKKENKDEPTVLDIGCAYGPFLQAANENGWHPYGTDICEDAVKSVQDELHFPACTAAFPEIDTVREFGVRYFDAVTMWYVIEHFQDLDAVLKQVQKLLKTGGVFSFSTPSGEGVSAKTDFHEFYKNSPIDHFSVWEPSRVRKILKKYGFRIVRKISTGHHPERFPSIRRNGAKPGSFRWKLVEKYSRVFKLGDTVEIYCVKK